MTSSSPLASLLSCLPSAQDPTLTLRQLVAVHDALLNNSTAPAGDAGTTTSGASTGHTGEGAQSVEEVVRSLLPADDEAEVQTCLDALNGTTAQSDTKNDNEHVCDAGALLAAQYLLRRARRAAATGSATETILVALHSVVLPLLLRTPADTSKDDDEDSSGKKTTTSPLLKREVRDAIIEAAFASSTSTTTTNATATESSSSTSSTGKLLERCTTDCVASVQSLSSTSARSVEHRRMVVETTAKLLIKLLSLAKDADGADDTSNLDAEVVLQAIHSVVLDVARSIGMSTAAGGSNGDLRLLRPLTGLLLPVLWDGDHNTAGTSTGSSSSNEKNTKARATELWTFLSDTIAGAASSSTTTTNDDRRCRNWSDVAPMIATGILCSSIRGLNATLGLSRNSALWEFVKTTLQRMGVGDGQQGAMKTGGAFSSTGLAADADAGAVDQILRRRAIHILGLLVESEEKGKGNGGGGDSSSAENRELIVSWKKFVMCYEALELENELHLVEQVWPTTTELCAACSRGAAASAMATTAAAPDTSDSCMPPITWEWIGSLFARILQSDSPTLKKLALYRFLIGDAGVSVSAKKIDLVAEAEAAAQAAAKEAKEREEAKKQPKQRGRAKAGKKAAAKKKKGGGGGGKGKKAAAEPSRLSIVSPSFIFTVLLPSFDSLFASVGTNIHIDVNGKVVADELIPRLQRFLADYMNTLREDEPELLGELLNGILSRDFICARRHRPLMQIYEAIADTASKDESKLPLARATAEEAALALKETFATGGTLHKVRESILSSFACILANSRAGGTDQAHPPLVLTILDLYQSPITSFGHEDDKSDAGVEKKDTNYYRELSAKHLLTWLAGIDGSGTGEWAASAGAACASAYVAGQLLPPQETRAGSSRLYVGKIDREMGASIVKLCALAGSASHSKSASEMLWPAINKGLSQASPFLPNNSPKGQSAPVPMPFKIKSSIARAIVLLDHGCLERVLNGMGHGDLVIGSNGQMLPPPSEIESLLATCVGVILTQIRLIVSCKDGNENAGQSQGGDGATRSGVTGELSSGLARWCDCLKTLCDAFPSSIILERTANDLLIESIDQFMTPSDAESDSEATKEMRKALLMALIYASLSCGGDYSSTAVTGDSAPQRASPTAVCEFIIQCNFVVPGGDLGGEYTKSQLTAARSLYQASKWSALSYLVPMTFVEGQVDHQDLRAFHCRVFDAASDAILATPENALLPLFDTALSAARLAVGAIEEGGELNKEESLLSYSKFVNSIVDSLFGVLSETIHGPSRVYMINAACSVLFRPRLLINEYDSNAESGIVDDRSNDTWPIRKAFHMLLKLSQRKPHISAAATSYITAAWLGIDSDEGRKTMGLSAIPYRKDIVRLLAYKEDKVEDAAAFQNAALTTSGSKVDIIGETASLDLPTDTNAQSLVRGFLLVFFSKLPNPGEDLDGRVLADLCHKIILDLLDSMCTDDAKKASTSFITGSPEYCHKIRAWQALCILHRFVTGDVAEAVAEKVYKTMEQNLHGQIRYFQELFTIQCHRKHPKVFLQRFVSEVRRTDLTQQHVSSLMIVAGNLIVGRYAEEFFAVFSKEDVKGPLHEVLAGTLPWLSSTQGFARAIAQLLVHKMVPIVLDADPDLGKTNWYLHTMYQFLDFNPDMARLRKKQAKFFTEYEVDSVCTPEGILSIPVDVGDEADPVHLVQSIKRCLEEVYDEAHETEGPQWKQIKAALEDVDGAGGDSSNDEDDDDEALVGFQRKIVPIDSLNLSLEDSQQQSLRNAAGRKRQELIVCATFVDKIPNLGGLARTSEIFAADKLVIPDKRVVKMDNFKSISVSAGDWIPIEEVKEEVSGDRRTCQMLRFELDFSHRVM